MLKDTDRITKSPQECCGREMTVVERLEYKRSSLITQLSEIEAAIKEVNRKDITPDLVRVLSKLD